MKYSRRYINESLKYWKKQLMIHEALSQPAAKPDALNLVVVCATVAFGSIDADEWRDLGGRPGRVKRFGNWMNFNCNVEKFYLVNDKIMQRLFDTNVFYSNVSNNTIIDILTQNNVTPVKEIVKHAGQISRHYGLEHDSVFFNTIARIKKSNNIKDQIWTISITYVNPGTCVSSFDKNSGVTRKVMVGDWCLYDQNSNFSNDVVVAPCDRAAAKQLLSSGSYDEQKDQQLKDYMGFAGLREYVRQVTGNEETTQRIFGEISPETLVAESRCAMKALKYWKTKLAECIEYDTSRKVR